MNNIVLDNKAVENNISNGTNIPQPKETKMFREFKVGQAITATKNVYSSTVKNSEIIKKGETVIVDNVRKDLSFRSNGRDWFLYRPSAGVDRTRFFELATVDVTMKELEEHFGQKIRIIG